MLDIQSAGKELYLSASPQKEKTVTETLELIFYIFVDVVKVILLSLVELIRLLFCAWTFKPKVIKGQTALITGGGNGIGNAIALELAKCGCNIVIADVDKLAMKNTLLLLEKYNVKSVAFTTDVSSPQEVQNLKKAIDESLGPVHILINNAALMPKLSLREGSSADIKRLVDVNLNANFWTVRTFLPDMLKQRNSHIVQMSSMAALHPSSHVVVYTATKYALTGFMLALEEELRQEGAGDCVDFTTVYPYFVATRKDLMNVLNLRVSALTAEYTAQKTVEGILHKKRRVVVPRYDLLFNFVDCLPYEIQCYVRDYILQEPYEIPNKP